MQQYTLPNSSTPLQMLQRKYHLHQLSKTSASNKRFPDRMQYTNVVHVIDPISPTGILLPGFFSTIANLLLMNSVEFLMAVSISWRTLRAAAEFSAPRHVSTSLMFVKETILPVWFRTQGSSH